MPSRDAGFGAARSSTPTTPEPARPLLAGDWYVVEFDARDRQVPLTRAVEVARALRGAVLAHAAELPEALTGHRKDAAPTKEPHLAFVALPCVRREDANGRIAGAAIVLPTDASTAAESGRLRGNVSTALRRWRAAAPDALELWLGPAGRVRGHVVAEPSLMSLRRDQWAGPQVGSTAWVSVTPIALPRHPGHLSDRSPERRRRAELEAEAQVSRACAHAGLPAPERVVVSRERLLAGVPFARAFPPFVQLDRSRRRGIARVQVHAALTFAQPVRGPLLLGSGRYFGLGLMRPVAMHVR